MKLPPFSDFPPELKDIMSGPVFYLDGGRYKCSFACG